jgi:(p)ppGpp synthase/HD superfamily hydrolase
MNEPNHHNYIRIAQAIEYIQAHFKEQPSLDEIAEKGYAAHYKYKNGATEESGLDVWLNLLREALENAETNAVDFVEDFKMNLYSKEYKYSKLKILISDIIR